MKKPTLLILLLITILSCKNADENSDKSQSSLIEVSENEQNGIDNVLNYYGGELAYKFGYSLSTDKGKEKYFELQLDKSNVIEKWRNNPDLIGSNIAYLFYKNLDEEEQNEYDIIRANLTFNDGQQNKFTYSTETLNKVDKKMTFVNEIIDEIQSGEFQKIEPYLNNELVKYDKDELISRLEAVDPNFGELKEFRPLGFKIAKQKNGIEILHISGAVIRTKANHEFSVDLDLNSDEKEIYQLQYKL
ncbi:hypothetical protein [Christiangramia echinicola]|uniref:Uncharacterized protein n=1 Tax=Christiangramia echinicola TaxID=279359 RepID=A0A1H1KU92_9FLAO|nr:hypothetical protein [Christiangramia echinicola]SDR65908.1 hypothetical protein SAMN04488552_0210 [Christiangramia echinicola]